AHLYARLFDPVNTGAILFLGRQHVGKTALLHNAITIFRETTVGVYVPLRETNLDTEAYWLLALAQAITTVLVEDGYTVSRLSQLDPIGDQPRQWLEVTFLPQVLGAVRRKLLILLDDADCLLMAVRSGQLPSDTFAYLASLAKKFQNLYFALTLDAVYESDVDDFAPLVAPIDVIRLTNLNADETQWLLQMPARGLYVVPDDLALSAHKLIGGAPGLAQHLGYEFFRRWETYPELNVFTLDDLKTVTSALYLYNEADYRGLWERLNANERIVLTAISDLHYNDPLGKLDATAIQGWLVETDFPLDITAINATLRSLEYRDVLAPTPGGIALSASLMQSWLLDNARLGRRMPPSASGAPPPEPTRGFAVTPRLLRTLFIILVILVIANIIAYAWVNSGSPGIAPNLEPTVTLSTSQ
ncbi:MAG: hypothetical protein LC121_23845, partial [Anaerolineae bacterium]|nr:hypothetical protein [Anaerolineae bacterium]